MTSAIGSSYGAAMMQRPDPAQMASRLFSKLDTKNQGYIEKSDLKSALGNISGSSGSSAAAGVDEVFKQLDGDSDGKITKDEMSSGFKKLAEALDSQFGQMRMQGHGGHGGPGGMQGMAGMPPPPPQGGQDTGFTKDELTQQLQDMGSTDSKRSSLISSIVDNFDKADTNGNGKVTFQEAKTFGKANQSASGTATEDSATGSTASATQSSEAKVMHTIMQLMHAYGRPDQSSSQSAASALLAVAA